MAANRIRRRLAQAHIGHWEQWMDRTVLALGRLPWGRSGFGRAYGLLRIFHFVAWVLERSHPSHVLRPGGVLRYEIAPLPGRRALALPGRSPVRPGEQVVGLHFDNRVITALAASSPGTRRLTWQLARIAVKDLQALANLAREGTLPPEIRAVWAETLFYRSMTRYGFTIHRSPRSLRTPFARLFMLSLLAIYGRPGKAVQERALQRLELGIAWMDIEELKRRFPPADQPRQEPERRANVSAVRSAPAS